MPLKTGGFVAAPAHMDRHVRDDFRDVEVHMHTLMDYYGGRDHRDGRYRR